MDILNEEVDSILLDSIESEGILTLEKSRSKRKQQQKRANQINKAINQFRRQFERGELDGDASDGGTKRERAIEYIKLMEKELDRASVSIKSKRIIADRLKKLKSDIASRSVDADEPDEPEEEEPLEDKPQRSGGAYKFMGQTQSFGLPSEAKRTNTLQEDKLVEIVIDFAKLREQQLDESFLAMFGGWVEHILNAMFGGLDIPVSVRGNDREVQAFATALGREKRYIDVAKRYGLDHPSTYKSKAKLTGAAKNFERETGIKWPFK